MKKSKAILYLIVLSTFAASQNVPDTWVTLETAALDTVMFSLSEEGINMEVHSAHPADTVSIVRLAREDLPFLTNIFHDRFDRCGGYRVHHTLEDSGTSRGDSAPAAGARHAAGPETGCCRVRPARGAFACLAWLSRQHATAPQTGLLRRQTVSRNHLIR